ncbi:MAG: NupC/NupG family nucleoside CNT transporter [Myxococcales bacterium]|nr:NupC/NupG family nucleoside CNT transporter [Myxococcales bacterium]
MTDLGLRAMSGFGFFAMIAIAWCVSTDRSKIPWRVIAWGVGLQFALGLLLLKSSFGAAFFVAVNQLVNGLLVYAAAGTKFVFGSLVETGFSFALNVLPVIIFMGSLIAVLYHLGLVQRIVNAFAWLLSKTMRVSGAEALAAVANVFVGMVESALVIKPYLARMTRSELFSLMTLGMATVSGSVLITYVGFLGSVDGAGHLVIASLLSAPAGLLIAKVMLPESGNPETASGASATQSIDDLDSRASNIIDAAATGAINGLKLAAYIGALLIAFYALLEMANSILGYAGSFFGNPTLSFQGVLGIIMTPFAYLMGIASQDVAQVGSLLGVKTVLNEFIAYRELGELVKAGSLQPRSVIIASYALCGFANFGSLAILLGGMEGMAPDRRHEVARLGMRSILSGTLTTFMTACIVGMLL